MSVSILDSHELGLSLVESSWCLALGDLPACSAVEAIFPLGSFVDWL